MSWTNYKASLELQAQKHIDPAIRLYTKDNWFCTLLAYLAFWMPNETFLTRFATSIGPLIFIPKDWETSQVKRLLPHEGRHVKHARWLGLWIHPWVGLPLYLVLYCLLPFPCYIAIFRYWFEKDADKQYWLELRRQGRLNAYIVDRAERFGNTVGGWSYLHPLPTRSLCKAGFKRAAIKLLRKG